MKLKVLVYLFFFANISLFGDSFYFNPWGVWDSGEVTENSPIRTLSTGSYFHTNREFYWVAVAKNNRGIVAGNFNFPQIGILGMFIQIEKFESIDNGYALHLIGRGLRSGDNRTYIRENVRLVLNMIFVSSDEVIFQYESKLDPDGFRLTFYVIENVIHRRYRVPYE